jgi:hypothetical protein
MVEQKDFIVALAGAAATISSFSLALVGVLSAIRPPESKRRSIVALGYGAAATFVFGLFSTVASLQWLYAEAPGSVTLLRGFWFNPNRVYQSAWITFFLTCLGVLYVAIVAAVFTLPRSEIPSPEDTKGKRTGQ